MPWGVRRAWWGIIAVIILNFIFLTVISFLQFTIKFPAPLAVGVLSVLLYAGILVLVYFLISGQVAALSFRSFPFFKGVGLALLFFGGIFAFQIFWGFLLKVLGIKMPDNIAPIKQLFGISPVGLVVIFLLTVVVAPVVEETFFRGFLYQAFKKRYGVILGLLISSLIFGLFHLSFIVALPVFVLIGVLLGYIFEIFGSIYPAIMLHAVNNLFFFFILVYKT